MPIFLNTDISQGSVATRLGCGGVFVHDFVTNFLLSLTVKEFWTSVNIWWSYGQELVVFFDSQCITASLYKQQKVKRKESKGQDLGAQCSLNTVLHSFVNIRDWRKLPGTSVKYQQWTVSNIAAGNKTQMVLSHHNNIVLKLIHTATPDTTKLSCLCCVRIGGVNWIPDNSRLSPTENLKSEQWSNSHRHTRHDTDRTV